LLARERQPHAYWHMVGKPLVLSCGPLASLETLRAMGEFTKAFDDPKLSEVDDTPVGTIGAFCDLTRMEWAE